MDNEDNLPDPDKSPGIWSPSPMEETPPSDGRNGPAWEWRRQLGFRRALLLTIREVLLSPGQCFELARRTGGLSRPLGFNIAVNLLVLLIIAGLGLLAYLIHPAYAIERHPEIFGSPWFAEMTQGSLLVNLAIGFIAFWFTLIFLIIFLCLKVFIFSAIFHVFLFVLGGARQGFEATFRTMAYVDGATTVLNLIPWVGGFLGIIVFLIQTIIGLKHMHETRMWKCVMAVLAPAMIFIILAVLIIAIFQMALEMAVVPAPA